MQEDTIETQLALLRNRWDGQHWRWWALVAGLLIVPGMAVIAILFSLVLGDPIKGLWTFGLLAALFVLSLLGSGMIKNTSRRVTRGGLAHRSATIETDNRSPEERKAEEERERKELDRRTIRMGIMALPVFVTFIYLLLS